MMRFESKVALVTGGRSGIGQAIARRLRDEGAHVFTAQRGQDLEFDSIIADFTDLDCPARVVSEVIENCSASFARAKREHSQYRIYRRTG